MFRFLTLWRERARQAQVLRNAIDARREAAVRYAEAKARNDSRAKHTTYHALRAATHAELTALMAALRHDVTTSLRASRGSERAKAVGGSAR